MFAVVSGAGWSYETLSRRDDDRRHPAPGRSIDVGGHRLHLHCTGAAGGAPTVVFEAGLGESSTTWATLHQRLTAGTARVRACSYDRAGYAWSDPGPGRRDAGRLAEELHTLLDRAGERGPFVLVGHSFGGFVVRLFADRWPGETAGMVLVDVTDERGIGELEASAPIVRTQMTAFRFAARTGLVRLFPGLAVPADAPPAVRAHAAVVYRSTSMAAAADEAAASADSARLVQSTVRPGAWRTWPVVVISAAGQPREALDQHARLAALSSRGQHVVAAIDDHYVHYGQPELVLDAVRRTVDAGGAQRPHRR
ncbi:Pimeloyl-ACP methyl ester carboxylesterase [Micromonospora pallida]|uniref:Pimeloyl-ACP methyl ester carboxylesterase n=1 Tax=Micromonospora pallida TaxID=145854 RepID=A0A1C6RWP7_9ACTN|nr:Pimeloyl-ACP methyl ester carboxylesterase [Micromonospora pallida]